MTKHRIINVILIAAIVACVIWAAVQCQRLNQPGAATLWSLPAVENFWSLVLLAVALGFGVAANWFLSLFAAPSGSGTTGKPSVMTPGGPVTPLEKRAAVGRTLSILGLEAGNLFAEGNIAGVRSLADAADAIKKGAT